MTPQTIDTASESAQRIAARYVPANSQAMTYDDISAVVYTYLTRDGRSAAIAYKGTARKPNFHLVFGNNDGAREAYVCKWVAGQQERMRTRQAEQLAKRGESHMLTEGAIVVSSWGYEQTNVDFYQVVRVISPKTVALRQIGGSLTDDGTTGAMSGYKVPQPGAFLADEPEMRCRARGTHVTGIRRGGRSASLWNGKPQHCSWYA